LDALISEIATLVDRKTSRKRGFEEMAANRRQTSSFSTPLYTHEKIRTDFMGFFKTTAAMPDLYEIGEFPLIKYERTGPQSTQIRFEYSFFGIGRALPPWWVLDQIEKTVQVIWLPCQRRFFCTLMRVLAHSYQEGIPCPLDRIDDNKL
jgi:hypothetical protein